MVVILYMTYHLVLGEKNIGYVMQDNPMINDSIKKNLLYGNSNNLTEKELTHFTKMTDSYDFINNTTNGFNTLIGERGIRLSGGQKQKLDLTRNIIKILLFYYLMKQPPI